LLGEPFATAWQAKPATQHAAAGLRQRLRQRVAASVQAEAPMRTVRQRASARRDLAPGVQVQPLYRSPHEATARRPGEPALALLLHFEAGACLAPDALAALAPATLHREWLVLQGDFSSSGLPQAATALTARDYAVQPAGNPLAGWQAHTAGALFLRTSEPGQAADQQPQVVRDAAAGWHDFAPGIRRRVLWSHGAQAALLYHAQPGSQIPAHRHGHDEECLAVQGELFLDDVLMQPGDYQLAPAGSGHHTTETDTGVVIYAHGDLELQLNG
jgi:quercetin dioxygenase-like cupin family protein